MADDGAVKVISRLTVDYSRAVKGVRELSEEYAKLNNLLKTAEKYATTATQKIGQSVGSGISTGVQQAVAKSKQSLNDLATTSKKSLGDISVLLPKLESQLSQVQAKLARAGLSGGALDKQAASLRAQVATAQQFSTVEGQLTEKETEYLATLSKEIQILKERANIAINDQAPAQLRYQQTVQRLAAEAKLNQTLARQTAQQQLQVQAAQAALPQMQAQLASTQSRLQMERVSTKQLKENGKYLREQVDLLLQAAKAQGTLTDEQAQQVTQLQAQIKAYKAEASTAISTAQMNRGAFGSMLTRRLEWFGAGLLFYGGQQAFSSLVNDIGDVEEKMISLSRVMEDPLYDVKQMRTELFELGKEYGQSFGNVQDIALRWAQAGYDMSETLELTRSSLLALNTAELDAEESTDDLIGIMAQWGFEADQLTGIIDKINKVADDYAVTSQDLVDGLLRASGAAKNANMTFDETVAVITAMRESSGRTGKEVGNALNSIIAYMQRTKSLETMQKAGISVYADAAQTKLRPILDILHDLAANWNKMEDSGLAQTFMDDAEAAGLFTEQMAEATGSLEEWTDLQKRDILQAGAGVYRRNYLLALLNNFAEVYDVLNTEQQAAGYSMRENERTMEGYTKKLQSLKTAMQELGYALAEEGGLLDSLKNLVTGTTKAVDAFNNLPSGAKKAVIALSDFVLGIVTVNWGLKLLTGTNLKGAIIKLVDLKTKVSGLTKAAGDLTAVIQGGSKALGWVGLAATAAALIVKKIVDINNEAYRLQNNFTKTKEQTDALISSLEAEEEQHSKNIALLKQVADQYRVLAKEKEEATKRGETEAAEELATQQEMLSDKVVEALGRETAARLEAAGYAEQAVQDEIKAERDKADAVAKSVQEQIEAYRENLQAQIRDTLDSIQTIERHQEGWLSYLGVWSRVKVAFYEAMHSIRLAWNATLQWITEKWASFDNWVASKLEALPSWLPGYSKIQGWAGSLRARAAADYEKSALYDTRMEQVDAEYEAAIDSIAQARITEQRKLLADLQAELESLSASAESSLNGYTQGVEGAADATDDLDKKAEDAKESEESLADAARDLADAYTAQTEALQGIGDQYQRQEKLLRNRIEYNTREGASIGELLWADQDRLALVENLTNQQANLHDTAEAARQAVSNLTAELGNLDTSTEEGAQAYKELTDAIAEQRQIADDAAAEWWSLQKDIADVQSENNYASQYTIKKLEELEEAYEYGKLALKDYALILEVLGNQANLSTEALDALAEAQKKLDEMKFDETVEKLQDAFKSGFITTEQYVQALAALQKQGNLSRDAMKQLADEQKEALTDFYSDALEAELKRVEDTYNAAVDQIDSELDAAMDRLDRNLERSLDRIDRKLQAKIRPWQEELEALQGEQTENERDRALQEHEQTLADLEEQRRYHELRIGKEHADALRDLDKQIAEENRRWEQQQQDWILSDREAYLEERIQQAEDAAEEERKKVEDEAERQREALEKEAERQREDLEKHYDKVKEITEKGIMDTIAALASTDKSWFDTGKMLIDSLIAGLESGNVSGALQLIDEIRQAAQNAASAITGIDFDIVPYTTQQAIPAYDIGAWEIPRTQLSIVHPEEMILPPVAAKTFRSVIPMLGNLDRVIESAVNRVVQAITSQAGGPINIYGAQNAYLEDEVDADTLSRSIARNVMRLNAVRG